MPILETIGLSRSSWASPGTQQLSVTQFLWENILLNSKPPTHKWSFDLLLVYKWGFVRIHCWCERKMSSFLNCSFTWTLTSPLTHLQYTKTSYRSFNSAVQLLFYSFPINLLLDYLDFGISFENWAMFSLFKLKKEMIYWNNTVHYSGLIMFVIHHPVIWGNFLPFTFHHVFFVTYGPCEIVLIQSPQ